MYNIFIGNIPRQNPTEQWTNTWTMKDRNVKQDTFRGRVIAAGGG
jgi:hypothetical protein